MQNSFETKKNEKKKERKKSKKKHFENDVKPRLGYFR